ncbi:MAG TPA: VWA domain-containing protein [Thermoanaerobaculia bacterium]|nr:VWA domain-containing protein [Thermoanaerobaculia bacterium]
MRAIRAVWTAGLVAAAVARAQEAPPVQPPVFGETLEVRVVNLEVVVTDRDGLPVTGLGVDDFRLLVDGEPLPIRYFSEVRGGDAVGPEAVGRGSVSGIPQIVPGTPVGSSYLVFVDDFFSIARDRDAVLRSLSEEVTGLGPEDRMAVVAWDGTALEMLTSWTQSTPDLQRAFRAAIGRKAHGLERISEARAFGYDRQISRGFETGGRRRPLDARLNLTERQYAALIEEQVGNAVSAVAAALRAFANPPGRKSLILLSGGWPFDPIDFAAGSFAGAFDEPGFLTSEELFRPLVATANQVGYTVYPVDVPGMVGALGRDVTAGGLSAEGNAGNAFLYETLVHWSLRHVAEETGGLALVNAERTSPLGRVAADTRSYYWLGFVPEWQGDDADHAVAVEVRPEGLLVRGRRGFVDLSRRAETSMIVESVLVFGDGPGVRPLDLALGEPRKAGLGRIHLPIRIEVPADEITFLPAEGGVVADLELRMAAIDASGGRSDVPVLPVRLSAPRQPEPGEKATYATTLELRRSKGRIVVALYDPLSGTIWSAVADVVP